MTILRTLFIVLQFVLFGIATVHAQQYAYDPQTGTSNSDIPLKSIADSKYQGIYYPSNFVGSPPSGNITVLYVKTPILMASATFTNLTVKIGNTVLNTMPSQNWQAGLTTVYTGAYTGIADFDGWLPITLQTAFPYTNTSNIVIEISQTASSNPGLQTIHEQCRPGPLVVMR